jgi:hypothetical protein
MLALMLTLMMEAVCSSETSANLYQPTCHHIPEDSAFYNLQYLYTIVIHALNHVTNLSRQYIKQEDITQLTKMNSHNVN